MLDELSARRRREQSQGTPGPVDAEVKATAVRVWDDLQQHMGQQGARLVVYQLMTELIRLTVAIGEDWDDGRAG